MQQNGSPEPVFETDENRIYFLAKLPIHNKLKYRGQAKGQAEGQAPPKPLNDTERSVLKLLEKGPSSRSEVLDALGMEKRTGYFRRILDRLMNDGLIIYTHPETPKHPNQKYKITDVGRRQLK